MPESGNSNIGREAAISSGNSLPNPPDAGHIPSASDRLDTPAAQLPVQSGSSLLRQSPLVRWFKRLGGRLSSHPDYSSLVQFEGDEPLASGSEEGSSTHPLVEIEGDQSTVSGQSDLLVQIENADVIQGEESRRAHPLFLTSRMQEQLQQALASDDVANIHFILADANGEVIGIRDGAAYLLNLDQTNAGKFAQGLSARQNSGLLDQLRIAKNLSAIIDMGVSAADDPNNTQMGIHVVGVALPDGFSQSFNDVMTRAFLSGDIKDPLPYTLVYREPGSGKLRQTIMGFDPVLHKPSIVISPVETIV